MNKKTVVCALALLMVYMSCARAQQYDSEDDFRVAPLDGGKSAEIIGYVGTKQTVNIPPRIQGMPVTKIGNEVFAFREIIRVTIPKGIMEIGTSAFAHTSLISITLPAGLTSIGLNAFGGCAGLTKITIPASVTSIGNYAFGYCPNLTSVTFAGTIASGSFGSNMTFPGNLRTVFYATDSANGTPGTYTVTSGTGDNKVWTRQQ